MKPAPQDTKRILRISVLACLLLDLLLTGFLLSPWAPSKAAGEQRLSDLTHDYQRLSDRVIALERLQGRIHTSQTQIQSLLSTAMPEEREASSVVLTEVQRLAQQSQVQAQGMSFKADHKAQEGLRRVQVQLAVTGNYNGVVQFLNQIERSPLFFLIDGISATSGIQRINGGPPTGDVRLLVSLEVYVRVASTAPQGGHQA